MLPVAPMPPSTITVPLTAEVESTSAFAYTLLSAIMLLPITLPLTSIVPVMFAPVLSTSIISVPPTLMNTLPPDVGILTLLVPLSMIDKSNVSQLSPPEPSDVMY
jgi:hypothetical protein